MQVEFGNATPKDALGVRVDLGAPTVTYMHIPDDYSAEAGADVQEFRRHLSDALLDRDGVTHKPDHEAMLAAVHPNGAWRSHGSGLPTWVWSDNPELQRFLGEFYGCPVGRPEGLEDTHFTRFGAPGVVPGATLDLEANITQTGRDMWARALGGGSIGDTGTSSGATATSLTDASKAWTVNAFQGQRVVAGGVWATIKSNTATALTLDRWYAPATPGGSAGTTPGATSVYVILDGNAPSWFVGLTADTAAPASPSTATVLTSEIVTAGGGLVRKIAPFAHTASTNTYSVTPVWTANGSDTLPVILAKIGVFCSMVVAATPTMLFETLMSVTATMAAVGDQLTVSEVVTGT